MYRTVIINTLLFPTGVPQGQDVMLLSETRQQNTEVRLSLSKVSDKVDQLMQKVSPAYNELNPGLCSYFNAKNTLPYKQFLS